MSFRNESYFWRQIAELPFDTFQIRMRAKSQHSAETGGRSTGHLVDVILRRDVRSGAHMRESRMLPKYTGSPIRVWASWNGAR